MDIAIVLSEQQFAAAYRLHFARTIRFLQAHGLPHDLAEELSQEAWTRGWACRGQLKDQDSIVFWINSIARNLLRADFRRRKATEELTEHSAAVSASVDALTLSDLLSHCREEDRQLLVRHYMEGWSSTELAQSLGIAPVSVRVRLLRIKNGLREALGPDTSATASVQLLGTPAGTSGLPSHQN